MLSNRSAIVDNRINIIQILADLQDNLDAGSFGEDFIIWIYHAEISSFWIDMSTPKDAHVLFESEWSVGARGFGEGFHDGIIQLLGFGH